MRFLLLTVIAFACTSTSAHAYIDPGSTLLLLQGLLAFFGGLLVFVKHPIKTIKSLFAKLRGKKDA